MKAFVLKEFKGPLQLEEAERPRATPGRALVRVKAVGICYRDWLGWQGWQRLKLPAIPGHEFAGVVEEAGEGVQLRPGDRVAAMVLEYCGQCEYCRNGREYLCRSRRIYGEDVPGAFAEYVSADARSLVKVPDGVPLEAAAFAACVVATALRAARKAGAGPGRRVLVTGAGGGVGIHAVQAVKALGAEAIAVTSPAKAEAVARYADHVIAARDFAEEVRRLGGADGAVEVVGGPTLEQTARAVKWGGRIALVGNVDPRPVQLPLGPLILREVEVLPVIHASRGDLEEALRLMADGRIRPVYTVHPFSEIPALLQSTPDARHIGRRVAVAAGGGGVRRGGGAGSFLFPPSAGGGRA